MIKALLCDLDGTLINTLPLHISAYRKTLKILGYEKSTEWIHNHCLNRTPTIICQDLGIPDKQYLFKDTYIAIANSFSTRAKLFKGALDVLKLIKQNQIKTALITLAHRYYIDNLLNNLNLNNYFDLIVSNDDVVHVKPAVDAVIKACRNLGVNEAESLVIGDSHNDILMGKNAGAKTILFYPKEHHSIYDLELLKQSNPDYIISDWNQLREIL